MIDSGDLIEIAQRLVVTPTQDKPRQAALRRAMRTAYYALFHRILQEGADRLVGDTEELRRSKSWSLVYRAFNHGTMAERCGQVTQPPAPFNRSDFPAAVCFVATAFKTLQNERHRADYDPAALFEVEGVQGRVETARNAINRLDELKTADSALFVTFLLFGARRGSA